ncbi:MAG: SDR family NAD(P)-dependent oxidoreductase, partial [Chloroflexota bacterium]
MDDIAGKVALVTGGSRGIGRAIALSLASAGVDVAINYRSRQAEAAETVAMIEQQGRRAIAIPADVADGPQVNTLVAEVERQLGPVEILVNNAGITRPQLWTEITEQSWREILDQNLTSVFLVTQAILPQMVAAGWGRVIILSSVAAQLGGTVGPHYAASKAGLHGLMHSYAALTATSGVTVNAIAPALIETEMLIGNPNVRKDLIPMKRFGQVNEVADIALMLARNG